MVYAGLVLLLVVTGGCGEGSLAQRLEGEWIGRADSPAAKERRSPSIPEPASADSANDPDRPPGADPQGGSALLDAAPDPQPAAEPTDLQAFDFEITLWFGPRGALQMQFGDDPRIDGSWQVVTEAERRAVLEVTAVDQRRFEIEMESGDAGFTLREEGADPRFGWLYFTRAGPPPTTTPPPPVP